VPDLPPPAPPEERTAGQLVAEALRLYGRRFWAALALGVPPTALAALFIALADSELRRGLRLLVVAVAGSVVISACYVAACRIAAGRPLQGSILTAFLAGVVVSLPLPVLIGLFYLPGLAWFALVGLAVPAALFESRSLGAAFRRGIQLAKADYAHALGSLAAVTIVAVVSAGALSFLLVQFGDTTRGIGAFVALLFLSPLLLLAPAILYYDQEARVAKNADRAVEA
jgi:hypothetical protein